MDQKERTIYLGNVRNFFNDEKGKMIIKKIAPEVYNEIIGNPEILKISQYENKSSLAGNYEIILNGIPLYAGESGNVFIRACEHIYNMCHDEMKFGFLLPNDDLEVSFVITHLGISDWKRRLEIESEAIIERKHILQYTSTKAPEYGNDKKKFDRNKKRWILRQNIPLDYCVIPEIRKKRVQEAIVGVK